MRIARYGWLYDKHDLSRMPDEIANEIGANNFQREVLAAWYKLFLEDQDQFMAASGKALDDPDFGAFLTPSIYIERPPTPDEGD